MEEKGYCHIIILDKTKQLLPHVIDASLTVHTYLLRFFFKDSSSSGTSGTDVQLTMFSQVE